MSIMKEGKKYDLEDRLIDFAVGIIRLVEEIPRTRSGYHIAGQVTRCGTSPAANYGEAQSAESGTDFVHKMRICLKELRETRIWLKMILRAKLLSSANAQVLVQECDELISIFVASIRTSVSRRKGISKRESQ